MEIPSRIKKGAAVVATPFVLFLGYNERTNLWPAMAEARCAEDVAADVHESPTMPLDISEDCRDPLEHAEERFHLQIRGGEDRAEEIEPNPDYPMGPVAVNALALVTQDRLDRLKDGRLGYAARRAAALELATGAAALFLLVKSYASGPTYNQAT